MNTLVAYLLGVGTAWLVAAVVALVVGRAIRWATADLDHSDQAGA